MAIQFACPHCGKQTVVADQYAGQTGPCASCGVRVTIPQAGLGAAGPSSAPKSGGSTLFVIVGILAVCVLVCCGGGAGLVFFGRSQVMVAQQRNISRNNLMQIGLALHNYHDIHGKLPPAVVADAAGQPLYSGRVLLLPYLEQTPLFDRFDKTKAWNSPENLALSQTVIRTFQDPANKTGAPQRCDYVFVTGAGTTFDGKQAIRLADVTDGTSNTILALCTSNGAESWAAPTDWNVESGMVPRTTTPERIHVLFGDASVRMVKTSYFQQYMTSLASRAGDEVVPNEQ